MSVAGSAAVAEPGEMLAWWQGNKLSLAALAALEKGKAVMILSGGRQARVPVSRVAFSLGPVEGSLDASPGGARFHQEAISSLDRMEKEISSLASGVDVAVLWELVLEEGAQPAEALASLALGRRDGPACAATIRALLEEGAFFRRKGDLWAPRSGEAVEAIQVQQEADARRERERAALLAWFADPSGDWPPGRDAAVYLSALERAVLNQGEPDRETDPKALEALRAAGIRFDRLDEGAFRFLHKIGRYRDRDENLQIERFRLRAAFPEPVAEQAAAMASAGFLREGRTDLTGVPVITVDSASTREIDDGLSLEPLARGRTRVGIHIADPAAFIPAGSAVDEEALARGLTHYFPERRLTLLPPVLGEGAASLTAGEERPALSFLAELDRDGEVIAWEVTRSRVLVRERWTYEQADRNILSEATIRPAGDDAPGFAGLLDRFRQMRESCRNRNGAIGIFTPEPELSVDEAGKCTLRRLDPLSLSRRAVTEAMILAGELAARFCVERNLPAIFRKQDPPGGDLVRPSGPVVDLVEARKIRMRLKRGEPVLKPAPHDSLALSAYVQATSPLRRYMDMVVHRQILSALDGREPVYREADLGRILSRCVKAEADARKAERARAEYWTLRYLEDRAARGNDLLEAVVVQAEPKAVIHLEEPVLERSVRALTGHSPGDRVTMQVIRVNPRAGLLVLRPAAQT